MNQIELENHVQELSIEADDLRDRIKELLEEMVEMQDIIDSQKEKIEDYEAALSEIQDITKKLV